MKKRTAKKLRLITTKISKIQLPKIKNLKGGTEPVSIPAGLSAHASQCGHLNCM
ncbi:MAG: hypothetical protein AAF617_03770 [Bacteroidota bacterium]